MKRMRMAVSIVTGCLAGAIGCADEGPISTSIAAAVDRGPGTRLELQEHAAFPWDHACIFGPYTPDERVEAVTGIRGAAGRAFDIRSNDAINVLMFLDKGRVAASVAHPRRRGDFGPDIAGRCYPREQAVFSVRNPPDHSWGNIGPP